MSDLLATVAAAIGVPESLVERSAEARAAANGTSADDILAAWSGGAPPVAAAAPVEAAATEVAPAAAPEPEVVEEAPAVIAVAAPPPVAEPVAVEEVERIDPVPFGRRVRTATRIGAWTGAALGLVGFLVATTWWAATATVTGEGPYSAVIQADTNNVIIGLALASILFGAITAGLSRASAGWTNPGMRLSNSKSSTAWLGAFIGLILGVVAGAILTSGFGVPIEGSEGLVQLPVLPTLAVMLIGGAVLGAITAAATQAVAVPVAVAEDDESEIDSVRGRLSGAVSVPLVALMILLVLVLPFAWALIESAHLTAGGASIVGIITASAILGFATLAGGKPNMKIGFGEVMVAVIGIGVVLVLIFAVLFARSAGDHDEDTHEEARAVLVIS